MEYAGLLIGLRGIKQSLPTLQPAPEVIFIEGIAESVLGALTWVGGIRRLSCGTPSCRAQGVREAMFATQAMSMNQGFRGLGRVRVKSHASCSSGLFGNRVVRSMLHDLDGHHPFKAYAGRRRLQACSRPPRRRSCGAELAQ